MTAEGFKQHGPQHLVSAPLPAHTSRTNEDRCCSRIVGKLQKLCELTLPDLAALRGGLQPAHLFAKAPGAKAERERLDPPVPYFWVFHYQVLNHAMPRSGGRIGYPAFSTLICCGLPAFFRLCGVASLN